MDIYEFLNQYTSFNTYPERTQLIIEDRVAYSMSSFQAIDLMNALESYVYIPNSRFIGTYSIDEIRKHVKKPVMRYNLPLNINHLSRICPLRFIYPSVRYLFYTLSYTDVVVKHKLSKVIVSIDIEEVPVEKPVYRYSPIWIPGCIIIRAVGTRYYETFEEPINVVSTYTLFERVPKQLCDISI